jgi:hypothetical protein
LQGCLSQLWVVRVPSHENLSTVVKKKALNGYGRSPLEKKEKSDWKSQYGFNIYTL